MNVIVTPRSSNAKTGDIPQIWIGTTRDESRASCDAVECKLRPWDPNRKPSDMACYAHAGSPLWAFVSAAKGPYAKQTLEEVVAQRSPQAQAIRVGALGDPAVLSWGWWYKLGRLAKKLGLRVLSYSHGWRQRPDLAGHTMASCDSFEEAVEARRAGFQPAVAIRGVSVTAKGLKLPDGTPAIICPAMYAKAMNKAPVTCNQCLKCDGKGDFAVIFPDHGPGAARNAHRGSAK